MKDLLPKTIEEWLTKKSGFVNLLEETSDPAMARDYEGAISFCDRHIIRLYRNPPKVYKRVKYAVIAISIAVILSIVLFGCIENTMRGAGNAVQGLGKLVTGVGTDVVRGVDGYSKEK